MEQAYTISRNGDLRAVLVFLLLDCFRSAQETLPPGTAFEIRALPPGLCDFGRGSTPESKMGWYTDAGIAMCGGARIPAFVHVDDFEPLEMRWKAERGYYELGRYMTDPAE